MTAFHLLILPRKLRNNYNLIMLPFRRQFLSRSYTIHSRRGVTSDGKLSIGVLLASVVPRLSLSLKTHQIVRCLVTSYQEQILKMNDSQEKDSATDFESLGIRPPICDSLRTNFNIIAPTPAQSILIPAILSGRDILLRDHTGTGKTFGITLALLSQSRSQTVASLHSKSRKLAVTSLFVAPNRELVLQVEAWIHRMISAQDVLSIKNVVQTLISGGGDTDEKEDIMIARQQEDLAAHVPHVVVGTPTRVLDMVKSGALDVTGLRTIVLDEVDQALKLPKRFATQQKIRLRKMHPKPAEQLLRLVFDKVGEDLRRTKKLQLVVSSATLNRQLRYFLSSAGWISEALFIDFAKGSAAPAQLKHHCLIVSSDTIRNMSALSTTSSRDGEDAQEMWDSDEPLNNYPSNEQFNDDDDRMLESVAIACELEHVERGLVFVNTNPSMSKLIERLGRHGIKAQELISFIPESSSSPSSSSPKLIVATENTARGVDLPDISHVFILGIPSTVANYLHMAGRTGRMGRDGTVVTFVRERGRAEDRIRTMFKLTNVKVERFEHVQ
ncbi:P-loop containing nucleoside triphosphate hydrolase protein [Endogone sp. FLAS-F59071]|nr:P-loop containing nucleoside triphosphate hydrolase protein [Endogone sp. FLAS-F59071]|eukprot:RUS18589.1 P-loop containing nucleoside triphosphate hydrolase protein [Endogone sp. FLAS-F59071]